MFSIEVAVVQQSSLHFSQHAIDSGIVIAEHCRHPGASTQRSQWYRFCKELTTDQPLLGISGGSMVLQDRALSICMWVTWLSSRLELPVTIYVSNQLWHDEIWCRDEAWSRGRATLWSLMATKGRKTTSCLNVINFTAAILWGQNPLWVLESNARMWFYFNWPRASFHFIYWRQTRVSLGPRWMCLLCPYNTQRASVMWYCTLRADLGDNTPPLMALYLGQM